MSQTRDDGPRTPTTLNPLQRPTAPEMEGTMNRPSTRPLVIAMISAITLLGACSGASDPEDTADTTTTTAVIFSGGVSGASGGATPVATPNDTENAESDDAVATDDESSADDLGRSDVTLPAATTGLSPECLAMLDYFQIDEDGIDLTIAPDDARERFAQTIPRLRDDIQPAALTYAEVVARGYDLIATYGSWDEMMADEAGVLAWSDIFFLNTEYNEAYEALRAHLDVVCPPSGD